MLCLLHKEEKKCENIDLIVGFLFEDNEIIQHFWQRLILAKELSITKNFFHLIQVMNLGKHVL